MSPADLDLYMRPADTCDSQRSTASTRPDAHRRKGASGEPSSRASSPDTAQRNLHRFAIDPARGIRGEKGDSVRDFLRVQRTLRRVGGHRLSPGLIEASSL